MANEREPVVKKHPLQDKIEAAIDQLPDGVKEHWRTAFAGAGVITVASLGLIYWRSREKAGADLRKKFDEMVEKLPRPSKILDKLAIVELAQETDFLLKELILKGEIKVLDLMVEACEELGTHLDGKHISDDLIEAASRAALAAEAEATSKER